MAEQAEQPKATTLSPREHAFVAAYLSSARFNATEAARQAGYKQTDAALRVTGSRLLSNANVQEAIAEWRAQVQSVAIADVDYRVSVLDDLERRYRALIDVRAEEYDDVPGGDLGILVRQVKMSPTGENVTEYVADVAITKEIRDLHKQAAQELGQWDEKVNVSGSLKREYIIIQSSPDEETTSALEQG